jgi:hypothetical protein
VSATGRRAALPQSGYRRPDILSTDGLVVTVVGEDGRDNGSYDFRDAAGADQLKRELVAVFAALASAAGTWTTAGTCRAYAKVLRRFLRFAADHTPPVTRAAEITSGVWRAWQLSVGGGPFGDVGLVRRLLREVALPAATRAVVEARSRKPPQGQVASYTFEEFRLIRDAARRAVTAAETRIGEGARLVEDWRAGRLDPDSVQGRWGRLLDQISLTGEFPFVVHSLGPDAVHTATGGLVRTSTEALRRLYPSYQEVAAAAVLLICHEGWNTATLAEMDVPDQHPNADADSDESGDGPVVQRVATVKRRRPRHGGTPATTSSTSGRAAPAAPCARCWPSPHQPGQPWRRWAPRRAGCWSPAATPATDIYHGSATATRRCWRTPSPDGPSTPA